MPANDSTAESGLASSSGPSESTQTRSSAGARSPEDNIPKDFHGAELADAYDNLATADRWLGRVRATQNYSYWRYAGDAMTAGVAAARREPKGGWTRYGPPSYWSKLGRSRGTRDKRDYVAQHIAETGGMSMASARNDVMPFLSAMTHHCTNRELTVTMAARYDLEAEHVAFVTGSGEDTNKVQDIVADAAELRDEEAVSHAEGAFEGATRTTGEPETGDGSDDETNADPTDTEDEGEQNGDAGDDSTDGDSQSGLADFC